MVVDKVLKEKISSAKQLIKKCLTKHKDPVIACSFGKNSMVVLDLVYKYRPDITVLFNDTLVEYPDTYSFKNYIVDTWKLNIIVTKPTKNFWWVVENYGFPLFSRKGHKDATKNCCRYLKEYPLAKILRKYKFDLYFTGLTRFESRLREFSARKYGDYFYSKTQSHWKCHPIQNWTEEDVWNYHKIEKLPYNGLYDKEPVAGFILRSGCWCCTIPIKYGKIEFLRKNYPKHWKILLKKGLGDLVVKHKLGHEISDKRLKFLIENRPCIFDKF
ncbi:MAG: phosphoadenosine phosphosulfate reductase family protein [candidate division Zixibacteria bacterium]